jgi:hypothetical protein
MERKEHRGRGPVVSEVPVGGERPDERVGDAPRGLVDVQNMSTTIGAASGGYLRETEADPDDLEQARLRLRDAQIALVSLGYDVSDGNTGGGGDGIDGMWGPTTRDAIAEFQGEHELPRTGQLDSDTYEALLGAYETALEAEGGDPEMVDEDDFDPIKPSRPLNES